MAIVKLIIEFILLAFELLIGIITTLIDVILGWFGG